MGWKISSSLRATG